MLAVLMMSLAVLHQAAADKKYEAKVETKTFGFGFDKHIYGSYEGHSPTHLKPYPKSKYEPAPPHKIEKLLPPTYLS